MKRILVVEDNEANMYLIRFILRKNGYEVTEARKVEVRLEEFGFDDVVKEVV